MSDESIKRPSSVVPSDFLLNQEKEKSLNHKKNEGEKKQQQNKDEAQNHLNDLKVMVEKTNERLIQDNSSFRFKIEERSNEIIIDIMKVDDRDEMVAVIKKNITHEGFVETARHILNGEGFIIDIVL